MSKFSRKRKLSIILIIILLIIIGHFALNRPSNERDWNIDQKILPYSALEGNVMKVHNIRNFNYRSTTDYDIDYYDKDYNIDEIETVDYIVEPFGSIGAAHTFLSFGFKNGDYLAISVEIRKEKGESFSAVKGLFRQYELMYVVADERDVVKLRSNYRKDTVYIYPIKTSSENSKKELFLDMFSRINSLAQKPEFYNTLTNTCTTNIVDHVNSVSPKKIPLDYRVLFPKNSDELAYKIGLIDTDLSLEEAREKFKINEKAELYADDVDFSKKIRQ